MWSFIRQKLRSSEEIREISLLQTLRVRVAASEEDGVIVQGSEAASNEEGFSSDNVWLEVSSPFLSFACPGRARRASADKLNGISIQPRLVFTLLRLRRRLQTTLLESRSTSFPLSLAHPPSP